MDNRVKFFSHTWFVITGMTIIILVSVLINVADAPPLEATNPAIILCYQIDDSGRIIDNDGRVRGWMKGSEVYGPDFELRYRLAGKRLEDAR